MAISVVSALKAKRQAFSAAQSLGLGSSLTQLLSAFFQEHAQKNGNLDLLVVTAVAASTTDAVVAGEACKLYGVFLKGGASAADIRWADHATSANSPTVTIPVAISEQIALVSVAGKAMTTGLTFDESGASGANGFFIIGAA